MGLITRARGGRLTGGINERPVPDTLFRILIAGGEASEKRLRMTVRVIAELKHRMIAGQVIVFGQWGDELRKLAIPDEVFVELTTEECGRLVRSCSVCLEAIDGEQDPSAIALLCAAEGRPLIVHGSSSIESGASIIRVEEWSADAFIDAIVGSGRSGTR